MSLTLHMHPLSSYCHKVLIALYELDAPFEPAFLDLMDEQAREAFFRLWPIGKMPVLEDKAAGVVQPETSVIIDYLNRRFGGDLIPDDPEAALETRVRAVIRAIVNAFHGRQRARKAVVQAVMARGTAIEMVAPVAAFLAQSGNEPRRGIGRLTPEQAFVLSRAVMEWFAGHYLEDAGHGEDWRVSPLRAKGLAGLAPAVVCTAWFDPLRDEGRAYAEALAAADVPTKYHHGAGLIHGYFGLGDASETARLEAQRARADFKAMLERGA